MSFINAATLANLACEANRAPSVHNTQPARWHVDQDGSILIACDLARVLATGDPLARDAGLSCGAAVEGTVMALARRGIGCDVEDLWALQNTAVLPGHRLAARLTPNGPGFEDDLERFADNRFTWRDRFLPADPQAQRLLADWAGATSDVTVVQSRDGIDWLARQNDETSMVFFRNRAFREELVGWMRLDPSRADYWSDGMNREAMRMGALTARAAGLLLGTSLFEAADSVGLGKALTAETGKTLSASTIVLFHRPATESPVVTGRAFYRFWLNLTRLGFAAWPMAALADHPESAAAITHRFGIDPDRRLVNVLRCGFAPQQPVRKARLTPGDLLI